MFDARFYHPSTILINLASSSGKTPLTKRILENRTSLFRADVPDYVVIIYHTWQNVYKEMDEESLIQLCLNELPDNQTLKEIGDEHKESGGSILVLDDQLNNLQSNIVDIVCVQSHHLKMTVILLVQTLFIPN